MYCLEGSLLWQEILGGTILFVQKNVCVKEYGHVSSEKIVLFSLSQKNQTAY